jgi:hypothetical protein
MNEDQFLITRELVVGNKCNPFTKLRLFKRK